MAYAWLKRGGLTRGLSVVIFTNNFLLFPLNLLSLKLVVRDLDRCSSLTSNDLSLILVVFQLSTQIQNINTIRLLPC